MHCSVHKDLTKGGNLRLLPVSQLSQWLYFFQPLHHLGTLLYNSCQLLPLSLCVLLKALQVQVQTINGCLQILLQVFSQQLCETTRSTR